MGQRHNRRRTRPRSRNRNSLNQETPASTITQAPGSALAIPSSIWSPQPTPAKSVAASYQSVACISPGSPAQVPAPTWHYGYMAWQIRETVPRWEAGGLEAEQYRLFGGQPGDDMSLCDRMLEYFGGLDYIDAMRDSALGE
ncbi:uncharacterized protein N7459_007493 [Penicillium hispanicum]|uniref:uncharacterized protein n=1 Tax=Penicillium hispanicum TaxID=1080232 RepID=UPI0025422FD6|nr:uncharacterized protein N7459_007493 [Penicillium hispanicum]KAJ5578529.1 hypothetical protein N7459_007493 [Penicillium hispanicum]